MIENGLAHIHNLLRWIILIMLLISISQAYRGWKSGASLKPKDKSTWLLTMIAAHFTLLIGLIQWLFGRYGILTTELPEGTNVMKTKFYRFFWLEHPFLMILGIILITLGYTRTKKSIPDTAKYRKAFWLFLIALIIILIGIPWPFREEIGRPLFPGMK